MYGYSVGNKGLKELFPCVEYLVGLIHISELLVIMAGSKLGLLALMSCNQMGQQVMNTCYF